jgi:hypothetical protein
MEFDRFHIHQLRRDGRTTFIVVRRGTINPKQTVNVRSEDKEPVERLIQLLNG